MKAAGLILADNVASLSVELTEHRTLSAVPFGAKYRLIDFSLSNMINADIGSVGIIMSHQYDSVMHHVQSGAEWDLDRKQGGLRYLPPLSSAGSSISEGTRLEILRNNRFYIEQLKEKYLILSGTGYAASLDFRALLDRHIETGADITCLFSRNVVNQTPLCDRMGLLTDPDGRIRSFDPAQYEALKSELTMSTCVVEREYFLNLLDSLTRNPRGLTSLESLQNMMDTSKIYAYFTNELVIYLEDLETYLSGSLALLDPEVRKQLFHAESGPVITKTKDSPATRYGKDAVVSNSLIADGAVIEGTVRNSVIFRGARVKKDAVVENCVILQDSTVGEGAHLNHAVLDKEVIINDGRLLSGYLTHPFFCRKKERI